MTEPGTPYHDPRKPREKSVWKIVGWLLVAIVVVAIVWWVAGLGGDAAERDLDEPETEPLEPALLAPPTEASPFPGRFSEMPG